MLLDRKKRKFSQSPESPASALDSLLKRQRRMSSSRSPYPSSHSSSSYPNRASLSDSDPDEDDAGPSTPAFLDDNMDWTPDHSELTAPLPRGRDSSPNSNEATGGDAIHHLQLLRDANPPVIVSYAVPPAPATSSSKPPPPAKLIPMALDIRPDAYLFHVKLPGYPPEGITVSCKKGNVVSVVADIWHLGQSLRHWDITFDSDVHTADIRASLDQTTHTLTLTARRFRRSIPIEYRVPHSKPQLAPPIIRLATARP